jgi:hypothetical protein
MPVVRDPVMSGNRYFGHGPEDTPDTPSFQRLHLMHGLGDQSFFEQSPIQRAPKLACLRVSGVLQRQRFSGWLSNVLGTYIKAGNPEERQEVTEDLGQSNERARTKLGTIWGVQTCR